MSSSTKKTIPSRQSRLCRKAHSPNPGPSRNSWARSKSIKVCIIATLYNFAETSKITPMFILSLSSAPTKYTPYQLRLWMTSSSVKGNSAKPKLSIIYCKCSMGYSICTVEKLYIGISNSAICSSTIPWKLKSGISDWRLNCNILAIRERPYAELPIISPPKYCNLRGMAAKLTSGVLESFAIHLPSEDHLSSPKMLKKPIRK